MGSKTRENTIFKKLLHFIEMGALPFALFTVLSISAAVAGRLALPAVVAAQKSMTGHDLPALPTPGVYKVDPDHSFTYFGAWHHVVGLVRGRFDKVTGTITASQDLAACSVDITIDPSSISTQIVERDEDLRGPAYFDVKKFPTMTYRGRGIRHVSGDSWTMDGSLTMHGVTKVVPLTFTFNGSMSDVPPGKPVRVAFHGSASTKRAYFDIGGRDNLMEVRGATAPDVEIEIDVEADAGK